jgi:hypothetical protein
VLLLGGINHNAATIATTKKYVISSCMDESAFDIVKVDASLHKQASILGVSESSQL